MNKNVLSKKIEKAQSRDDRQTRDYIGASAIGADCLRQIWYEYKGFEALEVPAKTRRTWAIGRHLEKLVVEWVQASGFKIELLSDTLVSANVPHFSGHIDALVFVGKKRFILEIKTAKDASFNKFVKEGIRKWNAQYHAQVQSYMGMSGIHQAYILVLNKDNSELADELVVFDEAFYKTLETKAMMIGKASVPPPKINASPIWFQCKLCKFHKVCHK